jgi:KDO2-lipid IV(A) lauroyltransferase
MIFAVMKKTFSNLAAALLFYLFIKPLSLFPMRLLYMLSDVLFLVFFYLTPYRKKVVRENIDRSFPEKSNQEKRRIMKAFYRHFCDLIVESVKIFSISEQEAKNRMRFRNPEIVNRFAAEGKSVILAGGHFNNWELFAVAIAGAVKHHCVALYKPLTNAFFDQKMRATRGMFGLEMVSIKEVQQSFERQLDRPTLSIFASDQSPSRSGKAYWMEFLNQDTAVLFGTERYALRYDQPVLFGCIHKVARGKYECEFRLITNSPTEVRHGEITETHTRMLERDICANPEFWLWTHRRWKRKREAIEA